MPWLASFRRIGVHVCLYRAVLGGARNHESTWSLGSRVGGTSEAPLSPCGHELLNLVSFSPPFAPVALRGAASEAEVCNSSVPTRKT